METLPAQTKEINPHITSSELGTLWNTYIGISSRLMIFDFLKDKTTDSEIKSILISYTDDLKNLKNEFAKLFINEKTAVPLAFNEQDINREVPPLFNDIFHIIFLRQMMKLTFGFNGVYLGISFNKEVQNLLRLDFDATYKYYTWTTDYLLKKGVLAKPPLVTMPTEIEFIEDTSYMSGFNILSAKRALNTIEVGYIYDSLDFNSFFMNLLSGFAQVAKEDEVKKYFKDGMEMAKKNIEKVSNLLLKNNIEPSTTRCGKASDSTTSPFSDKIMMYITSLITTTPLSYSGLGTPFSFRSDLPLFLGVITKNFFQYSKEGGKLMIKFKWMEEPPQMEDRYKLMK